jgi:hypothetical protein
VFSKLGFCGLKKATLAFLVALQWAYFASERWDSVVSEAFQVPILALSTLYECFRML